MAFMRAATWADAIKSDPSYQDDDQTAATAGQNIGYADLLRHKYWHFVDQPFSPDGTPLVPPPAPNARPQIPLLQSGAVRRRHHRRREVLRPGLAAASGGRRPPAASLCVALRRRRSQGRSRRQQRQDHRQRSAAGLRRSALLPVRPAGRAARVLRRHHRLGLRRGSGGGGGSRGCPRPTPSKAAISDEAVWIQEGFELAQSAVYVCADRRRRRSVRDHAGTIRPRPQARPERASPWRAAGSRAC